MNIIAFLKSRRKTTNRDGWWPTCVWYFFLIVLTLMAGVNIAFFIVNWQDLTITIDDTAIYITFVGFLFAFAGINIYSIFNTNIEEEKKRLYDLSEQYKTEIERTICLLDYSKKHIKYYQLSQMLAGALQFNAQLSDWLSEFDELAKSSSEYLYQLSLVDKDEYHEMSGDFTDINRSVHYLLEDFYKKITKADSTFFNEVDEYLKNEFLEQLCNTLNVVNEYQTKDFSVIDNQEPQKELTIKDGLTIAWDAFRRKWRKNY